MAVLTESEVVQLRRKVGSEPSDAELQAIYDRTGTLDDTAREILEIRLANLLAEPASFSVAGEYSQSTGANIDALTKALDELNDEATGGSTLRIVRPSRRHVR